jgi:RHS repeat-associated protein
LGERAVPATNPISAQMVAVLTEFGMVEGQDFTLESLQTPVEMGTLYPAFTSTMAKGTISADSPESSPESTSLAFVCSDRQYDMYWYHPNYLGSVDLVTNKAGRVHQFFMYTAWGEAMYDYTAQSSSGSFDSPYRFNGKELDKETGNLYFGQRYYQPQSSTWISVDRLASKYPALSPYCFVMNNPINLIDPNGDSVNVHAFMHRHQDQWQKTKSDLEELGGLTLGTSKSGRITYEINEEAVGYSPEAREMMMAAFGDKETTVDVFTMNGGGSWGKGNKMSLSIGQIQGFIDGTSKDLNSKTMGFGMVFLHELDHTDLGSKATHSIGEKTVFGTVGSTVERMNRIRSQMCSDYGQRMSYMPDKNGYIPFSSTSLTQSQMGWQPLNNKTVRIKP